MGFWKNLGNRILTNAQRTKLKMAKINRSVGKSAISEAGKTIRNVAATVAATKAYEQKQAVNMAKANSGNQSTTLDQALALYNKLIEGNADETGKTQKESTTQVGGGSRIDD